MASTGREQINWDWERAMGEEGCPHPAVFKSLLAGLPVQHVLLAKVVLGPVYIR